MMRNGESMGLQEDMIADRSEPCCKSYKPYTPKALTPTQNWQAPPHLLQARWSTWLDVV